MTPTRSAPAAAVAPHRRAVPDLRSDGRARDLAGDRTIRRRRSSPTRSRWRSSSRSITETGHATLRGLPRPAAPRSARTSTRRSGWINNVPTAYALLKALGAIADGARRVPGLRARPARRATAAGRCSPRPERASRRRSRTRPILVKEPTAYPIGDARAVPHRAVADASGPNGRLVLAIAGCVLGVWRQGPAPVLFRRARRCASLAVLWRRSG